MGMQLDVDLGYGLLLPREDSDSYDSLEEKLKSLLSDKEEPKWGWYLDDLFEALLSDYENLSFTVNYSGDFPTDAAIFINRLTSNGYYAAATLPGNLSLSHEETEELQDVARRLEIDYDPQIIAIPSYG